MSTRLRELLAQGLVVAPGCFDPFSARLAELAGFDAIHLTGLGVEATQLGAPDLGLMTVNELATHAARVASAVDIPILADIDTGFGGVLNIRRTIREMERAGVAGVHLEDQRMPKHCPLLAGRTVVDRAEAVTRIRAAVEARTDPDFVIVARTDADTVSVQEVIERANLYLEAGADMIMPIVLDVDGRPYGSLTPDEQMDLLRRITREIDGPVMGMGDAPPAGYTTDDLAKAGYSFMMFAAAALSAGANAMAEVFHEIRTTGTDANYLAAHPGRYNDPLELMRAAHLDDYTSFEQKVTTDPAL
ncbi:oxaloacetate decarboxylase [Rhodococcus sp. NPDC127530]|uniref:isocitrate lyase/PEP mutase family protein n=1 Tax=unclassified Rhodococcus (in: high G+C Gram-positive bacteria) TaxID=192944 RepID=UPI0036400DB1